MISTPAADTPRASPPAPTGVAFDDEGFLLEPADWTRALFGSCATLWRIVGLPHPGAEAMAYMH